MPRTYRCPVGSGHHDFVEGTPAYAAMMEFPSNKNASAPVWCPEHRLMLKQNLEVLPVPPTQYALLVVVADVSASMFMEGTGEGAQTKIALVSYALADVLRDLALPNAGTANSLLVGILTFGANALWLDAKAQAATFTTEPKLLTASELKKCLLLPALATTKELDRDAEVNALRARTLELLTTAREKCDGTGTNYELALGTCGKLLDTVQNEATRRALKPDWDEIYRDSGRRTYLRVFLYSDGAPNRGVSETEPLVALARGIFASDGLPLITSSFVNSGEESADELLGALSSSCPLHRSEKCAFPGSDAKNFRAIMRLASGGAGFCPQCLRERQRW